MVCIILKSLSTGKILKNKTYITYIKHIKHIYKIKKNIKTSI